mmetsp:Transcript_103/g.125  ORF Transcript_103/g.125 Transcript_103/m.125 type:complete len:225 (-) Transcript_103:720-1394(-)
MFENGTINATVMASYCVVLVICFLIPCIYSIRQRLAGNRNPLSGLRIAMRQSNIGVVSNERGYQEEEVIGQMEDIEAQNRARQKLEKEKEIQILENFKDVRIIIKESHLKEPESVKSDSNLILEGIVNGEIHLTVPSPGQEPTATMHVRFPDSCAICLAKYSPGETIIRSSNPNCSHAFHEECILKWLLWRSRLRKDLLCPCCRGNFVADIENNLNESSDPPAQ